jgi:hypothetical protein
MSNLISTVQKLSEAKGQLVQIELNDKTLTAALVHVGKDKAGKKWEAKVKISANDAYYTRTGESNSHSDEAVKRALLNAYAAVPK